MTFSSVENGLFMYEDRRARLRDCPEIFGGCYHGDSYRAKLAYQANCSRVVSISSGFYYRKPLQVKHLLKNKS